VMIRIPSRVSALTSDSVRAGVSSIGISLD